MTALSKGIEQIILIGDHQYEHHHFTMHCIVILTMSTDNFALRSITTILLLRRVTDLILTEVSLSGLS